MRTLVVNGLRLTGKRTAMGRHIEFLAQQWSRMEAPFDRIILMCPQNVPLNGLRSDSQITLRSFGGQWPNLIWEQVLLPRAARGAAMLFCPAYTCPLLYRGRVVVANHGIYERLPNEFSWWSQLRTTPLYRSSARRANWVIANSLSTKADLVKYYELPESRLDVIYPAAHELCFAIYSQEEIAREVTKIFGERVPFIIFIGKLAKRRNVPNLIRAFATVRQAASLPHRLLIIGPNTSGIPLSDLISEAGGPSVISYIPYVEMELLAKLYAGADLYILPTTYEGISQTMFEAMASGTAVLSVEHPTLHEGGGDAVYSVPSPSVDDLVRGMTALLTDDALRRDYAARGRRRAAQFSWRKTAEATLSILDRVADQSDRSPLD